MNCGVECASGYVVVCKRLCGGVGGPCDFSVTPVPIGLRFGFGTAFGLGLGLGLGDLTWD